MAKINTGSVMCYCSFKSFQIRFRMGNNLVAAICEFFFFSYIIIGLTSFVIFKQGAEAEDSFTMGE